MNVRFKSNDNLIAEFFKLESAGGLLLVIAAAFAMIFANTGLNDFYQNTLHTKISILYGDAGFSKSVLHWINDGLMAIFFFLIGLEVKREFARGQLSSKEQVVLPLVAAVGGIAAPALVYYFIAKDTPEFLGGWAIPAATDIAFALGVLAVLGKRAPISLKILLTAIAVLDDIAAVIIIAVFYTADLSTGALGMAAACTAVLFVMNRMKVSRVEAYVLIGIILWGSVLKSGVHATLAGVLTALLIPLNVEDEDGCEIVPKIEHTLHPWVAYLILPVFAFANAGVPLAGLTMEVLLSPVTLGIFLGLFVGKQLGIFSMVWATVKLGLAKRPDGVSWAQIYGVSALCGIGFTMSLFIGTLAFDDPAIESAVRLGVLCGSFASALLGSLVLYLSYKPQSKK